MKEFLTKLSLLILGLVFLWPVNLLAWEEEPEPFSLNELNKFIADLPQFSQWAQKEFREPGTTKLPGIPLAVTLDKETKTFLIQMGWKPERFFYILSHVYAGLSSEDVVVAQIESELELIKNNFSLPQEQKKQLLDILKKDIEKTQKAQATYMLPLQEQRLIDSKRKQLLDLFVKIGLIQ